MRIECSNCGAAYTIQPTGRKRRAKCRKCGGVIEIPAAEPEETPAGTAPQEDPSGTPPPLPPAGGRSRRPARRNRKNRGEREPRKPKEERTPLPLLVKILVGFSFLYVFVFLPLMIYTMLFGGLPGVEDVATQAIFLLILASLLALGLAGGGVGLLLRQSWAWIASVLIYAFFVLFNLKMTLPLLLLPLRPETQLYFLLVHTLPALLSIGALVILMLPGTRLIYGFKQKESQRLGRRGGKRRSGARTD